MKIEIELPKDVTYLLKMYAMVLDDTPPSFIETHLKTWAMDSLSVGRVIGEEIGACYREMTKNATAKTAA